MFAKACSRLIIFAFCLFWAPIRVVAGVDEALAAQANGDGARAVAEFAKLADKGDVRAMLTIGNIYW